MKRLPAKARGRPLLVEEKLDKEVELISRLFVRLEESSPRQLLSQLLQLLYEEQTGVSWQKAVGR